MEKNHTLSTVNRMLIRFVTDENAHQHLSNEEQEEMLKETEKLSAHWLMHAYRKTKKASLDTLVQLTQKVAVYLMDQLFDKDSQLLSGFSVIMQRNLLRFLDFLQTQFKNHFDFDAPLPRLTWEQMREKIVSGLEPCKKYGLRDTDAALVEILYKHCSALSGGKSQPSFKQGFYWMKLTEIIGFQVVPTNQATLRTIYTLISCNFNSAGFVQYVIQSYGQALPPETDATDYWAEHIRLINGIAEEPGMIMDPLMPGCKTMLFTAMDQLIQSYRYSQHTERLNLSVLNLPTALNGAELALWQRLEIEAKMKPVDIIRDHLRKIAQVYGTDSKPLNDGYLYEKYYKIDASTKRHLMDYLSEMRAILARLTN